jgi:hypothetical protein
LEKIGEWIGVDSRDRLHNQSIVNKHNLKLRGGGRIKELKLSKIKTNVNKNHMGKNMTSHCPTIVEM